VAETVSRNPPRLCRRLFVLLVDRSPRHRGPEDRILTDCLQHWGSFDWINLRANLSLRTEVSKTVRPISSCTSAEFKTSAPISTAACAPGIWLNQWASSINQSWCHFFRISCDILKNISSTSPQEN
jgi:hypothetical protein